MLDFPNSPTTGQVFNNWKWDGAKWVTTGGGGGAVSTDALNLATLGSDSLIYVPDAVHDGSTYGRANGAWGKALSASGGQTISGGFVLAPNNLGTIASSLTPNPLLGNYQFGTNGSAITINAPTSDCAMDILVINSASAGAITFFGYTVGSNTGDALTTTSGNRFVISIRRINAISTYTIKALQ
jgi:hypothetical protein